MAKSDFKAFATGDDANVLSQLDYEALVARSSGFQSGIAKSAQLNKVLRQSSIIATVLAQFIVDQTERDAIDNESIDVLVENLKAAIFNDTTLTGAPTAPTPDAKDDSMRLATTAFVQQLSATYATQQWVRDNAVNKTGDAMAGPLGTPDLIINQGLAGDKSAPLIYNDAGKRNIVFRTGSNKAYKYSVIDEEGLLTLPVRPVWNETPWDTGNFDPQKKAEINSPIFTGLPNAPTPAQFDSSTKLATMAALMRDRFGFSRFAHYDSSATLPAAVFGSVVDCINGSGPYTLTLPALSQSMEGSAIQFISHSSGVTISSGSAAKILLGMHGSDSGTSITLQNGDSATIVTDGQTWFVIDGSILLSATEIFGASLELNGYQKLPSGLIVQWGAFVSSASGDTKIVWPIAFPNSCLNVIATPNNSDASMVTQYNCNKFGGSFNNWILKNNRFSRMGFGSVQYVIIGN